MTGADDVTEDRIVDPEPQGEDAPIEFSLRPRTLAEFVGQPGAREHLRIILEASKQREEPCPHLLFLGPPGLGKTSLAHIVANEMGARIRVTSGPALERPGDIVTILSNLEAGDVLFIDEVHRLPRTVEEHMYSAMEDRAVDLVIGKGPAARTMRFPLEPFTLVGATTRTGMIAGPFRDRFGFHARLDYYSADDLTRIVQRSAHLLETEIDGDGAYEIGRRSRGTPRIANRLLHRVRDYSQVERDGKIDVDVAKSALELFHIDPLGLDRVDLELLECLVKRFSGRPTGLNTLAVAIGEEPETIEDVYEPFLVQLGFIERTARGRIATPDAWRHLGIEPPDPSARLF